MNKKVMTSIKLPTNMHYKLQQRVVSDGYGMRGKTQWVIEAIEAFLTVPNFAELVDIADDMDNNLTEILSIRLPEQLVITLEQVVVDVRRIYPAMEGVKSNLIRASILQRLIRESATSVAE